MAMNQMHVHDLGGQVLNERAPPSGKSFYVPLQRRIKATASMACTFPRTRGKMDLEELHVKATHPCMNCITSYLARRFDLFHSISP